MHFQRRTARETPAARIVRTPILGNRRTAMRVTVMGSGGTGGYFGGLLARAGEDVTFVARGAHLAAIRRNGLTVRSRLAGDFTVPARATDDPVDAGPSDLVLFCVKAYDTESAAERLRPAV